MEAESGSSAEISGASFSCRHFRPSVLPKQAPGYAKAIIAIREPANTFRARSSALAPLAASLRVLSERVHGTRNHGGAHVSLRSTEPLRWPPRPCRRWRPHRFTAPPHRTPRRLLYWTAADGAARREAYDALADAVACLGSLPAAAERWTAQAAALRRVAERGADDLPSARVAGGEAVSLHRVSLSDEPDQLFLLSK